MGVGVIIRTTADLGALVSERRVATGTTQADLAST